MDGRPVPSGENLDNLGPAWYGHTAGEWEDFAGMAGLEVIRLGADLDLRALRNELRWNDVAFKLGR